MRSLCHKAEYYLYVIRKPGRPKKLKTPKKTVKEERPWKPRPPRGGVATSVFRAWTESKTHIFTDPTHVEVIQAQGEVKHGVLSVSGSRVYFTHAGKSELVFEEAALLSMRFFGHDNPYFPISGEKWAYYFNPDLILYIKAVGSTDRSVVRAMRHTNDVERDFPVVIVMKSGNEYKVRNRGHVAVRDFFGFDPQVTTLPLDKVASVILSKWSKTKEPEEPEKPKQVREPRDQNLLPSVDDDLT